MTWKRMLLLLFSLMLVGLLAAFFVVSRQGTAGSEREVMGVRSVFPAGAQAPVADARNGWQGFAFAARFRFFRRPSPHAREDLRRLQEENFRAERWRVDLDLFDGGFYVLRRRGKGYDLVCVFAGGGMNYWADMHSPSSLDFSRRAFERFIVNLEIGGRRTAPEVAGQLAALRRRVPWLTVQAPAQFFAMMAGIFVLTLLVVYFVFRLSGAPPRRDGGGAEWCTSHATLRVSGFGRRKLTACCLCLEEDVLAIYRFRRPFMRIDLRQERQKLEWEKSGFRYRNIRVIMDYADFEKWRLRLMA